MKVILKADVKGSGKKGDIIEVSDGYAKNFLLKKGLADIATAGGINEIQQKRTAVAFHKAENIKAQKELAAKIDGTTVTVPIRVGNNGKVFGSVTTEKISEALFALGFEVDKKKINAKIGFRQLGVFDAEIRLIEGVIAKIKVNVVPLE
ncbi:MAG: 50S ribosomal protein L9 [Clostridia bacterium]|nr:50S ribosomal protein L9 [Clostridia bacterium]